MDFFSTTLKESNNIRLKIGTNLYLRHDNTIEKPATVVDGISVNVINLMLFRQVINYF